MKPLSGKSWLDSCYRSSRHEYLEEIQSLLTFSHASSGLVWWCISGARYRLRVCSKHTSHRYTAYRAVTRSCNEQREIARLSRDYHQYIYSRGTATPPCCLDWSGRQLVGEYVDRSSLEGTRLLLHELCSSNRKCRDYREISMPQPPALLHSTVEIATSTPRAVIARPYTPPLQEYSFLTVNYGSSREKRDEAHMVLPFNWSCGRGRMGNSKSVATLIHSVCSKGITSVLIH